MEKLRIVVGGYIGLYPTGGAIWDYIQYPLGLSLLGHDVYYIEDTFQYPIYQADGAAWNDASATIRFLKDTMAKFGMENRWAYRDVASGKSFGKSEKEILTICSGADLFINISCSTFMRDEYKKIPRRVLIDSDPMFTQIQFVKEIEGELKTSTKDLIQSHNYLFSFGENIGSADCQIPTLGLKWLKTRQPVCLDYWENSNIPRHDFTSIMNWSGRQKLFFKDQLWGQKDVEFEKFLELPLAVPEASFKVVINPPLNIESSFNKQSLFEKNWQVFHPSETVPDSASYANFIKTSSAEFSVAKQTYVDSNSGWFSCRSACYLAAGKPVVAQETGWSKIIPTGEGLFAFHNMETAIRSVRSILANPSLHARKAKELAQEFFDSNIVLKKMIDQII